MPARVHDLAAAPGARGRNLGRDHACRDDGGRHDVARDGTGRAATDRVEGRSGVAEIQRTRMVAALVEVVQERGVAQVTVAHVVARSGVSRRTFYELFEDREDCLIAAFEEAVARAARVVLPAFTAGGSWRERVRAALGAFLEFLDDEQGLGAFCIVDALGAGAAALERRAQIVQVLVDAIDEGRGESKGRVQPTRLTAEGVVGAVLGVLHARLVSIRAAGANGFQQAKAVRSSSTLELLGPLMGMIVLPYKGQAAAAQEAARPAPVPRRVAPPHSDPLRDLDMRLTYRTVRVLIAIAQAQGASNRQIADAAGVQDQGQISKLLARLEHLGLIDNRASGALRGEPNEWRLTPRGWEIERTIQQRAPAPA